MKKIVTCMIGVIMAAAMCFCASAATLDTNEQKVLDAMKSTVTVDGKTVAIPADLLTQVENYLKRDDVSITADQAAAIVEQVNKGIEVVKKAGVSDLTKLPGAQKTEIMKIAQTAAKEVNLTVSLDSSTHVITVLDANNKVVAKKEAAVKVTGPDMTMVTIFCGLALVLLTGCAAVAVKSKLSAK